jgi:hypothetical protein
MKFWKSWKNLALLLGLVALPSVAYAATTGFGEGCCPCPCCD